MTTRQLCIKLCKLIGFLSSIGMILILLIIVFVPDDHGHKLQSRDVFHTVKLGHGFNSKGFEAIISTWFKQAAETTYFFPINFDVALHVKSKGHMRTPFGSYGDKGEHYQGYFSYQINAEFDEFVAQNGKWWCHWEGDNYVNVDRLLRVLGEYNWRRPWYIGKAASHRLHSFVYEGKRYKDVRFAHGGAGFCISLKLVHKMLPLAYGGKMMHVSNATGARDDVVVGYIINGLLGVELTERDEFNSHYHWQRLVSLTNYQIPQQVSFSYNDKFYVNIAKPIKSFSIKDDPSRFYSIHCIIYPQVEFFLPPGAGSQCRTGHYSRLCSSSVVASGCPREHDQYPTDRDRYSNTRSNDGDPDAGTVYQRS